jgi:hypothetical protein
VTNGVFLFCNNNGVFPYHELVPICAWFVKKHLGVPVCLAADTATMQLIDAIPGIDRLLDHRIITDVPDHRGDRYYMDITGDTESSVSGPFLNTNRHTVYDLTPFDETLMIDLDFIVMNDYLNSVWGSESPLQINNTTAGLTADKAAHIEHIHALGIPLYWATVIYFRKSEEARLFFQGIEHIRQHFDYYSKLYRFNNYMFRNDYATSIMVHAMNGGLGEHAIQWPVQALPDPVLLFAWDEQPMLRIDADRAWFVANARGEAKYYSPACLQNQSVHVINKRSLVAVAGPWVAQQMEQAHV